MELRTQPANQTAFFFFGKQGIYYQHRDLALKTSQLAAERSTVDSLKRVIDRLQNDTLYIEQVAREKLGMAKPDEVVLKFVEKGKR